MIEDFFIIAIGVFLGKLIYSIFNGVVGGIYELIKEKNKNDKRN